MTQRGNERKGQREQESRRVEVMREEVEDYNEKIQERQLELQQRGIGVNPLLIQAIQVEILIQWAAPSEYGRARFDLQVAKRVLEQLSDEVVDPIMAQQVEFAREVKAAQDAAAAGKDKSGLYIPSTAAVADVEASKTNPLSAVPDATPVPDSPQEGTQPGGISGISVG